MNLEDLKTQLDHSIRTGDIQSVRQALQGLTAGKIPRPLIADFADLARRVRMEDWGLRLLRPIVRAPDIQKVVATAQELTVYAGLLIKLGALPEAQSILENLPSKNDPVVLNLMSQIFILQWNYRQAALHLQKILKHAKTDAYQKCVAQVNLAGALLFLQKTAEVQNALDEVFETCRVHQWDLLNGNALELAAQLAYLQRDKEKAKHFLDQASQRVGQHSHYSFFIEKWRALAELIDLKAGTPEADFVLAKIEKLRAKAISLNSWESVRDLDYHVGVFLNHEYLLLNVYFGTPYTSYRERIEGILIGKNLEIPDSYFRKLTEAPAERVLCLETGSEIGAPLEQPLKPGQMLYRLLNILAKDFYRPLGLGELFSSLFPGEYFNPDASGARVSHAINKFRQWTKLNHVPLDVQVESNRYSLIATGPYALQIFRDMRNASELAGAGFETQIQMLKKKWPYQSFSAKKAAIELGISVTSTNNLLKKAVEQKQVYKSGSGRSTLYHFQK